MSDELVFDAEAHAYYVAGERLPSVTQVIAHAGLVDYSQVPQFMLDFKATIGTAAHRATELDDDGDLDEASIDPRVLPYVEAWRQFREDSGVEIVAMEQRLWHPRYRYAGTLDRVVRLKGALAILELKTTAEHHERAVAIQTAGYFHAYNHGRPIEEKARCRYALQLRGDGTYRLHRYWEHRSDFAEFLGYLREMRGETSDAA